MIDTTPLGEKDYLNVTFNCAY